MRVLLILALFLLLGCSGRTASRSAPVALVAGETRVSTQLAAVDEPEQDPLAVDEGSLCAEARWTDAMACDEAGCVAAAAGATCVACVAQTQACLDELSSGCQELCVACLGAKRCEFLDRNVRLAQAHLTPGPKPGYQRIADRQIQIGALPGGILHAVTEDDLRFMSFRRQLTGLATLSQPHRLVLMDADGRRPLRAHVTMCQIMMSERGTWLLEQCEEDGTTLLHEGRTGFTRTRLDLAIVTRRIDAYDFHGERWLAGDNASGDRHLYDLAAGTAEPFEGFAAVSPGGDFVSTLSPAQISRRGSAEEVVYRGADSEVVYFLSDTQAVGQDGDDLRTINLLTGEVVEEREGPPEGVRWWRGHVVGGELVFIGGDHRATEVWRNGVRDTVHPPAAVAPDPVYVHEPGVKMLSSGALLVNTYLGATPWPSVADDLLRGGALWHAPHGEDAEIIGMVSGVVSVDIEREELAEIPIPERFRRKRTRHANGHLVALGEANTGEVLIVTPDRKQHVVMAPHRVYDAGVDADGRLHVVNDVGIASYPPGFQGEPRVSRHAAERPYRTLSADASHALFSDVLMHPALGHGPPKDAILVQTSDHRAVRSWSGSVCVFARRGRAIYGCMEGSFEAASIVTYDGLRRISSARVGQGWGHVAEVSDDGKRVITDAGANYGRSQGGVDLDVAEFHYLGDFMSRFAFHSDGRLMRVDGTYLELFDSNPATGE